MSAKMSRHIPSGEATLRVAAMVLIAGALARLILAAILDPGVDEAYAMAVATRWQLSWFDHPPMVFWWVKTTTTLAGPFFPDGVPVLILRLPFVLAFTATSVVMFDLARRLWGARAGLWTLVALTLAPFFLVSAGSWMVPDGPLLLFLALCARCLVEILYFSPDARSERRLWLAVGLTLGLAGLSKYHAVLFAVGAFAFILVTPHRRRLLAPAPWLAALMTCILVLPVLIWNASNDWASIMFQFSRAAPRDGKSWSGFARTIVGQMVYLGPWTLVGALYFTASQLRSEREIAGPAAFLTALALPAIVLFTCVPLWGGNSLPHWQMSGWLFLLPILGDGIAKAEVLHRNGYRLARVSAAGAVAMLLLAISAAGLVRMFPPSRTTVSNLQIESFLSESSSWRGLAAALAERGLLDTGSSGDARQATPLVATFHWIDGARLAEALGNRATVAVFGEDPRGFAFLADPATWLGRDVLLIGRPKTFAGGLEAVSHLFASIDMQAPIPVKLGDTVLFEAQMAIGRHLASPYILPYPQR